MEPFWLQLSSIQQTVNNSQRFHINRTRQFLYCTQRHMAKECWEWQCFSILSGKTDGNISTICITNSINISSNLIYLILQLTFILNVFNNCYSFFCKSKFVLGLMYEGELIIICNVGIFFLWLATLLVGYDRICMVSLSLSPNTVVQIWSWKWTCEFHDVNMDVLFICTKEEQWSIFHGIKVYQVPKCTLGSQCSMGTALSQCRVYKRIESFKNGYTSVMHEEGDGPATERNGVHVAFFSPKLLILRV